MKERQRQRETQRERETETDRHRDRDRYAHTHTQTELEKTTYLDPPHPSSLTRNDSANRGPLVAISTREMQSITLCAGIAILNLTTSGIGRFLGGPLEVGLSRVT